MGCSVNLGKVTYAYTDLPDIQEFGMAVPLVITNGAMIKIAWTAGTRSWLNVLGAAMLITPPTFNQALANNLSTDWIAALTSSGILPLFPANVQYHSLHVRDLRTANQPEFESTPANTPGTGATELLPLSLAAVATLRTNLAGRSFRGRVFFSGWNEGQNDGNGRQAPAVNAAIVALLNAFNSSIQTRGLQLAVLSRPAAAVTIPAVTRPARAGQANPVTLVLARDTRWESQRRRTGRT